MSIFQTNDLVNTECAENESSNVKWNVSKSPFDNFCCCCCWLGQQIHTEPMKSSESWIKKKKSIPHYDLIDCHHTDDNVNIMRYDLNDGASFSFWHNCCLHCSLQVTHNHCMNIKLPFITTFRLIFSISFLFESNTESTKWFRIRIKSL